MVDDVRGSKENERKFSMTSSTSFISKYNEYYLLIVIFLISHHWIAAAAACLLGFRFPPAHLAVASADPQHSCTYARANVELRVFVIK